MWEYDTETLWKDLNAHLVYGLATATTFRVLTVSFPRSTASATSSRCRCPAEPGPP